jgi:hypothetical protein
MFGERSEASRENDNLGEKEVTSFEEVKQTPSDSFARTHTPDGAARSSLDENATRTGVTDTSALAHGAGVTYTCAHNNGGIHPDVYVSVQTHKYGGLSPDVCVSGQTHKYGGMSPDACIPVHTQKNGGRTPGVSTVEVHDSSTGAQANNTSATDGWANNTGVANYSNPITP